MLDSGYSNEKNRHRLPKLTCRRDSGRHTPQGKEDFLAAKSYGLLFARIYLTIRDKDDSIKVYIVSPCLLKTGGGIGKVRIIISIF
jgi:hypothetical protein